MEGDLPDGWTLNHASLPGRKLGETCWSTRRVTIDPKYPEVVQRCTLAHELVHVERGPVLNEPGLAGREELAVRKITARRLIQIHDLGEALAESRELPCAAELLDVDVFTLRTRLAHLHPAEVHYLRRRLQCDPTECGTCPHRATCRKDTE